MTDVYNNIVLNITNADCDEWQYYLSRNDCNMTEVKRLILNAEFWFAKASISLPYLLAPVIIAGIVFCGRMVVHPDGSRAVVSEGVTRQQYVDKFYQKRAPKL